MRDFVESVPNWIVQSGGFEFVYDTTTSITLTNGVATKFIMTPNGAETVKYPGAFAGIWDDTNDKLFPALLNGAGIIRISFRGTYASGQPPHFDVFLDAGSDPIAPAGGGTNSVFLYADTPNFAKAAGDSQWFNFIIPLFVGADFAANGAAIILTGHGETITIDNMAITGLRIFNPAPGGAPAPSGSS
jgi:hypothetical protein